MAAQWALLSKHLITQYQNLKNRISPAQCENPPFLVDKILKKNIVHNIFYSQKQISFYLSFFFLELLLYTIKVDYSVCFDFLMVNGLFSRASHPITSMVALSSVVLFCSIVFFRMSLVFRD